MPQTIALVTGANKSIGYETVKGLLRLGMHVYLSSRDREAGQAAVDTLLAEGFADVSYVHLDVTDEASILAALEEIDRAHGRLDVLVNNAGASFRGGDILGADPQITQKTLDINLLGTSRLTQLAVPLLKKSKAGRVVNNTSTSGSLNLYLSDPARPKPFAYCLSKAGMNAATLMFADALREFGIKVNAVCPGYVHSAVSAFMGTRTPEQGAAILIRMATLDDDGPTGGFFNEDGPIPW